MSKRLFFIVALFLISNAVRLCAQASYINTMSGIYKLTGGIGSTQRELITNDCYLSTNLLSIAVYKDTVYYNTWNGELKRFTIGSPGSCETLIESGSPYNSLTVDRNGILYMASENLVRFDPHTKQLTDLGFMPYISGGDILFYKDKLLLAGYDPFDWSTGIFEININNPSASSLYMSTPYFIGLLSVPVSCGSSRYFGLSSYNTQNTDMIELDLVNKKILGTTCSMDEDVLDAASTTETGLDDGVSISSITKTSPGNCENTNGSINISASSAYAPFTYTLLNTGVTQSSGNFTNLRGGLYNFRITNAHGCTKDTTVALAEGAARAECNNMFIPTAFTPNNDGKNDLYKPSFPANAKNIVMQIYNRWGNVAYEGKGNNIYWDGSFKGAQQPVGVYIYLISYTDYTGETKTWKGTLTLLR